MTINYQFGDVDAAGALMGAPVAAARAEHQPIIRDVLATGDFWGGVVLAILALAACALTPWALAWSSIT